MAETIRRPPVHSLWEPGKRGAKQLDRSILPQPTFFLPAAKQFWAFS